ncbi:topoisomerase II [Pseudoalteromonas luteoviolacea]|uniref:Topoisomerase II n=4 Tax=Pseudoalteromonas TaxID=53246 RepID=A0A166XCT7_9GAMM|nr:topoisomerase II [Pseudoalteromonas luteoviolacea S2607]KZN40007.1 topoisomerase II [Pseudoalteromonas luteoviolacea NCIMB 1942]KZN42821.1 topoisomerase II [Pseudoalteromonas luteoviolacea NCIMB 1944]KZN55880.1 topoisomerase II [Pseudoalteromonas luteoviolacea CPMOR-2]KZN64072.1 topoisomerase II [Pseudoalteromonas luteoviolacea S4060-1]OCQ19682.1 topoisomerase II [Pseudoalteromonas luteoviolacea]
MSLVNSGGQYMVLDKQGYDELVMYLTQNLALFEKPGVVKPNAPKVVELIEDVIAEHVIRLCEQHTGLSTEQRSLIVREVDGIVYDLQEVLSSVVDQRVTEEQQEFIEEFAGLVKNLFDSAIQ